MDQINLKSVRSNIYKSSYFLIIGAQKAGTTALFHYLSKHPEIVGAKNKEVHFFNSESNYSQGVSFYKSQFNESHAECLYMDASPSYLASPAAPKRIFDFDPEIKMIVLFRDPVIRAYSAWQMYKKRYKLDRNWFFSEWLKSIGKPSSDFIRRKDEEIDDFYLYAKSEIECIKSSTPFSIEAPVLMQGLYANCLERYFSCFKKEQIFVIENEYFRCNVVATLKQVENFLCLNPFDWDSQDLSPVFEGGYLESASRNAKKLLGDYYAHHNENLFRLLGFSYSWQNDEIKDFLT